MRTPTVRSPPVYQVGDLVMLNGKNIQPRRPSRKLDHKNHTPFQIERIISPLAVKLTLPRKWTTDDVFHVSLVEPYRVSNLQAAPDLSRMFREEDDVDNSEEHDVEQIMGSTKKGRRVLYQVKWRNYPNRRDSTNEPFD
jgi:hypothetical protein